MFWFGAIVSLCYVPGMTGAFIATQWPVLAAVLPFWLLRKGPVTAFHWLGVVFLAYASIGAWFSPMPYASVFGLWLMCIMGLSLWFGTQLTDVRGLYAGLALGAGVSSALAVLQQFGLDFMPSTSVFPAGLYINSVHQGTVLALIAVALVTERMWGWVLPLAPGIVLSNSRGAWFALAIGVLGCGVRRAWVIAVAPIAIAGYLLVAPLSPSDTERMLIWDAAWHNLTLWGWGPGVFYGLLLPQHGTFSYPEHAHNDALQLLFEYGIGALLPFAVFAFALSRTQDREWPVVLASVAAGCYSFPLWMPIASFLALVTVGRILRNHAVARGYGGDSGRHVVQRRRSYA